MAAPSSSHIPTTTTQAQHPAGRWNVRRIVTRGLIGLMALLIVIQLVPYGRDHSNPAVRAEPAWNSPDTRAVFYRACGDCHSNETGWPWYSNIAPFSWLIQHDVQDGRSAFNVSEWGRRRNKGDEAAETIQRGSMPPWFYTPQHPTARLSAAERQQFIAGLVATFGSRGGDRRGAGGETDNHGD
jgi:mono/diheme cytochrome c family protein